LNLARPAASVAKKLAKKTLGRIPESAAEPAASGVWPQGGGEGREAAGRPWPECPEGGGGGLPPFGSHRETTRQALSDERAAGVWGAKTYATHKALKRAIARRIGAAAPLAGMPSSAGFDWMQKQSESLSRCGPRSLRVTTDGDPVARLVRGGLVPDVEVRSCHTRWCPDCESRRAAADAARLAEFLAAHEIEPLLGTLTQRADPAESAGQALNRLKEASVRFHRRAMRRRWIAGYTLTYEMTWRAERGWHAHVHALWVVAGRRDGRPWWDHADLLAAWRYALRTPGDPTNGGARIERIANVAEVTKYAMKPADVAGLPPSQLADLVVQLKDAHMFASGGNLAKCKRTQREELDAELVHPDDAPIVSLRTGEVVERADTARAWLGERLRSGVTAEHAMRVLLEWRALTERGRDPPSLMALFWWDS